MSPQISREKKICPQGEIAAYIDGELLPREELELEMHIAVCESCAAELNEQKKLLRALDFALEEEKDFQLPENFTKVVVTVAENNVSGLRRPQERFIAFFICTALFFLVILGLGEETEAVFGTFWKFVDQVMAVGGFVLHLVYGISIGIMIILRSISHHIIYGSVFSILFFAGILFAGLLVFSRLIVRSNRA